MGCLGNGTDRRRLHGHGLMASEHRIRRQPAHPGEICSTIHHFPRLPRPRDRTSVIIPWLKENYGCDVVAVCGDIGQGADELNGLEAKALRTGASEVYIEDMREEFVTQYLWKLVRSGGVYEHKYLLGTAVARPLLAKKQVEVALRTGCDGLAHGCTGKGNDQVRFELTYKALAPHLAVIAPWREWDIVSREDAIAYAQAHDV